MDTSARRCASVKMVLYVIQSLVAVDARKAGKVSSVNKVRIRKKKHFRLEQFSVECRKTKTKVITLINHNTARWTNQNSKQIHEAGAKRGKTRASKSRLVLVLLLIGWKSGAILFSQSQNVAVQNQSNREITFDTQLNTALSYFQVILPNAIT